MAWRRTADQPMAVRDKNKHLLLYDGLKIILFIIY